MKLNKISLYLLSIGMVLVLSNSLFAARGLPRQRDSYRYGIGHILDKIIEQNKEILAGQERIADTLKRIEELFERQGDTND